MRDATKAEIETAFYEEGFCEDCRKWRDDPEAKTQCKIAGYAAGGDNYKAAWKTDKNRTFCSKHRSRKPELKDCKKTELMKLMEGY